MQLFDAMMEVDEGYQASINDCRMKINMIKL